MTNRPNSRENCSYNIILIGYNILPLRKTQPKNGALFFEKSRMRFPHFQGGMGQSLAQTCPGRRKRLTTPQGSQGQGGIVLKKTGPEN